jgi:hypothetical protein
MINNLVSIGIGLLLGGVLAVALRGIRGRGRVRRGLAVSLPSIILMTVWALWRNSFPATFGPYTMACLWISLTVGPQERKDKV